MSADSNTLHERTYDFTMPVFEDKFDGEYVHRLHDIGATTVLLCIREEDIRVMRGEDIDVRNRQQDFYGAVEAAGKLGLTVMTNPWCVGRLFGPEEARSWVRKEDRCPENPEEQGLLNDFLRISTDLDASAVFFDEPHFDDCSCAGQEEKYLKEWADQTAALGMESTVCMVPTQNKVSNMPRLANLAAHPTIHGIGTDPYYTNFPGDNDDAPEDYVGRFARDIYMIQEQTGTPGHVWVQGFGLPTRGLDEPYDDWVKRAEEFSWEDVPYLATMPIINSNIYRVGMWTSLDWNVEHERVQIIKPLHPERVIEKAHLIVEGLKEATRSVQ